jgi:hypothetical protein
MRGARNTEKELSTVTKVAALSVRPRVTTLALASHVFRTSELTDELPWLNDPSGSEGNYCATANIDVSWEDARKINSSSNGVTTDVLEKDGEGKSKG